MTFAGFAHGSMRICDSLPMDVEGCICGARPDRARLVSREPWGRRARTGNLNPQVGAEREIGASSRARGPVFGMEGVWCV